MGKSVGDRRGRSRHRGAHGFHAGSRYQPKAIAELPPFQLPGRDPTQDGWQRLPQNARRILSGYFHPWGWPRGCIWGRIACREDCEAVRRGYACLRLDVQAGNAPARALYEKFGMLDTGYLVYELDFDKPVG